MGKQSLFLLITIFGIILVSCKKENGSNSPQEDNSTFFNITFNGKTLSNRGLSYNGISRSYICVLESIYGGGSHASNFYADLSGEAINSYFGNAPHNIDAKQQLEVYLHGTKKGTTLGSYFAGKDGYSSDNYGNYFIDLTDGYKMYNIDTTGYKINITTANQNIVKGTLSFNIRNNTKTYPATGSFSLKPLY